MRPSSDLGDSRRVTFEPTDPLETHPHGGANPPAVGLHPTRVAGVLLIFAAIYLAIKCSAGWDQVALDGFWFARWWVVVREHPERSAFALTLLTLACTPRPRSRSGS